MSTAILIIGVFFIQQNQAAPLNSWSCLTRDMENKQWIMTSNYGLAAMNKSFDACKKESNFPNSCKVIKENCDLYLQASVLQTQWVCTALDAQSNPWPGTGSSKQDEAALAAKANCRRNSLIPETCYINLITCKKVTLGE